MKLVESQIKAIDQEALKLVKLDDTLAARLDILVSIPAFPSHRLCDADRDVRARRARPTPGRLPGRARAACQGIGKMEGKALHLR